MGYGACYLISAAVQNTETGFLSKRKNNFLQYSQAPDERYTTENTVIESLDYGPFEAFLKQIALEGNGLSTTQTWK